MPVLEIVASAENNPYMEWQAMLFHYSCLTYHGQAPVIAVHKGDEALLPGFEVIARHGGRIQPVPNLRDFNDVSYPPRNSAVAMQFVETNADFIALCDADMIFLKPLPIDRLPIGPNTITFDRIGFLDPDRPAYQPQIDDVFRVNGIDPFVLRNPVIDGAVPHIVSTHHHKAVGDEWLRCIDLFPILYQGERPDSTDEQYANWPYRCYLASMWAILMAKHTLQLDHLETFLAMTNHDDLRQMPDLAETGFCMIHYAYGSPAFDKRSMIGDKNPTCAGFWNLPREDGSVAGYLRKQFVDAGHFYGLS